MRSSGGLCRYLPLGGRRLPRPEFQARDPSCGYGCRSLGSRKFEKAARPSGVSPCQPGLQPVGGWNGSILPMQSIGETPVEKTDV
jgi:hypothetical protein